MRASPRFRVGAAIVEYVRSANADALKGLLESAMDRTVVLKRPSVHPQRVGAGTSSVCHLFTNVRSVEEELAPKIFSVAFCRNEVSGPFRTSCRQSN